jgi:hypothetical protein
VWKSTGQHGDIAELRCGCRSLRSLVRVAS